MQEYSEGGKRCPLYLYVQSSVGLSLFLCVLFVFFFGYNHAFSHRHIEV